MWTVAESIYVGIVAAGVLLIVAQLPTEEALISVALLHFLVLLGCIIHVAAVAMSDD